MLIEIMFRERKDGEDMKYLKVLYRTVLFPTELQWSGCYTFFGAVPGSARGLIQWKIEIMLADDASGGKTVNVG